jgi:hypothetical protein
MISRKYWTEADCAKLTQLIAEGETAATIAKILGGTPAGVVARARILGLRPPPVKRAERTPRERNKPSAYSRLF